MKLYIFELYKYGKKDLLVEEIDVEEKEKIYVYKNLRRYNKSDIGKLSGSYRDRVVLLENNPSLAASLFIKEMENEIEGLKEKILNKQAYIDILNHYTIKGEKL